jgi:hypothetical protein
MTAPPIPERCASRPLVGGLVVPYISLVRDGRAHLGGTRGIRVAECIAARRCQICGQPITDMPILFLCTQSMIDDGFTSEPPLHAECGAYSAEACAMIAGRMATYSKNPHDATGQPCGLEGCDCAGWVTGTGGGKAGEPAEPWFRVWVSGYAIGVREAGPVTVGNVTGAVFEGRIVKTRPIRQAVTADA